MKYSGTNYVISRELARETERQMLESDKVKQSDDGEKSNNERERLHIQ